MFAGKMVCSIMQCVPTAKAHFGSQEMGFLFALYRADGVDCPQEMERN